MRKHFFFWNELKSTFWFIPVLIIIIGLLLSFGFIYIDINLEIKKEGLFRYFFSRNADSARDILGVIANSMAVVAGTVFSITLVALTMASTQFGPRLIKKFMYDTINQVVLGSYISTFIYCLIILNTINEEEPYAFIPYFSILFSILLSLANIILLVIFIHHIAINIQADKVISDIYQSLYENVKTLFPEKIGDELDQNELPDENGEKASYQRIEKIPALTNGYLQYIDNITLFETVSDMDGLIELHYRPGDLLIEGSVMVTAYSNYSLGEEMIGKIQKQFIIGKTRIQLQDAEFSIHQMVEIAVKALSEGENDPYTAIACIDNLTTTMCYLTGVKFPGRYHFSKDGKLRVISDNIDYDGLIDAAFNQVRQFSHNTPSVVIRLMEALITINNFDKDNSHKDAILKHARMVLNMAKESFREPNDLQDLLDRSRLIISD